MAVTKSAAPMPSIDVQGETIELRSESSQKSASTSATPIHANTDAPNSEHCGPSARQIPAIFASAQSAASSVGAAFGTMNYFGQFFHGNRRYQDIKHATVPMSTPTFEESEATMPAKGFGRWRGIPDLPPIMSSLSMQSAGDEPSYHVTASKHHHRQIGLKRNDQRRNDRWAVKDMGMKSNRKRCVYSILQNLAVVIVGVSIGAVVVFVLEKRGFFLPMSRLDTVPTKQPTPALAGLISIEESVIDDIDEGNVNRVSTFVPSSAPSTTPTLPILNLDLLENDGGGRDNVVETDSLPTNPQTASPQPSSSPTQSSTIAPTTTVPTMTPSTKALSEAPTGSPSSPPTLYNSPRSSPETSTSVSLSHEKDSQISSTNTDCSRMTAEDQYKSHLTKEIDETALSYLLSLDMFNLSWRMKVEFKENVSKMTAERFGPESEFTDAVQKAALRTLVFWTRREEEEEDPGVSLSDGTAMPRTVKIAGTHSSDVDDLIELGLAFVSLHKMTPEEGIEEARRVTQVVETKVPGGFHNPIFTMHGFAYDVSGEAGVILGDGMLRYLQNIPVPTRVPFTIALHSRLSSLVGAHLLHLDLGMPTILPSDQDPNTYQALFADVLGAYYMAHPLGGLLTGNEICTSFLAYVRSTGVEECDPSVEERDDIIPKIQLTSSQKSCAAIWAIRWAWVDNATAKSDTATVTGVASLSELKDRFDARYQRILNVDQSGTCPELSTFECMLY